jgi:hypothetical protein
MSPENAYPWATKNTKAAQSAALKSWWAQQDSNLRPRDYELMGELLCLEKAFVSERRLA